MELPIILSLVSLIIALIILFTLSKTKAKNPHIQTAIKKTENTRTFASLSFDLLLIIVSITITVYSFDIAKSGGNMTETLSTTAQSLTYLVWIIFGIAFAVFLFYIWELYISYKDAKLENEVLKQQVKITTIIDSGGDNKKQDTSPISLSLQGDLSKMDTEQLKTTKSIVDKLQK